MPLDDDRAESIITEQSDTLTIIQSQNGMKSYRFEAPLMEKYGFAKEPYREFRRGIYIETYDDSTGDIKSTLRADYAINFENRKLWEAKGNVVATNAQGHILETQQLFWNQKTEKVYSNVDSRVTQAGDILVGVGFESDEAFEVWEFRQPRGTLLVNMEPNRDTTTNRPSASEEQVVSTPASGSTPTGTDTNTANRATRSPEPPPTGPRTFVRDQERPAGERPTRLQPQTPAAVQTPQGPTSLESSRIFESPRRAGSLEEEN